jgi:hypothetical protein
VTIARVFALRKLGVFQKWPIVGNTGKENKSTQQGQFSIASIGVLSLHKREDFLIFARIYKKYSESVFCFMKLLLRPINALRRVLVEPLRVPIPAKSY